MAAEHKPRLLAAYRAFGQDFKQRRPELDLTHDAIANSVGCSTDTVYKIEAGPRRF